MSSLAEHPHKPLAASGAGSAERTRGGRWALWLAGVCALLLLAATLEIVLDGALAHSPLIPRSPAIAGWLQGVGERLGYRVFLVALLAFTGAYGVLLALFASGRAGAAAGQGRAGALGRAAPAGISPRWAIGLVAVLQLIVFAGPILLSTDVFSYIAYARMGVVHGLNPYLHGPAAIVGDPVYHYVGSDWKLVPTAYGPVYTLLSYPLGFLGVVGALWGMKAMALAAAAGTLWLTWRCARARELDPVFALLAVGANPLWLIYGLGGAHNDLLMCLLMMAAVALTLGGREAWAGASVVAGALIKATGAVLLPFMLLRAHPEGSPRRLAPVLGAALALLVGALAAYVAFGVHGVDIVAALNRDAAFVSTDSFPTEIAHLLGKPGVFPIDHDILKAALAAILLYLMWLTWRGYDWVAASGWALLAIAVTSTWLLAWYTLWPLPLALVTRDRRLLWAILAVQGLFILHQVAPLLAPVQ